MAKFKVEFSYEVGAYTEVENVETEEEARKAVDAILQQYGPDEKYLPHTTVHRDWDVMDAELID